MPHKFSGPFILLLLCSLTLLGVSSCSEEDDDGFNKDIITGGSFSGTIKVTARHFYREQGNFLDTLATNAEIILFKSAQDRQFLNNPTLSGVTDTAGKVNFINLPDSVYYLLGTYDYAPDVNETVNFGNSGAITFVEMNFISN